MKKAHSIDRRTCLKQLAAGAAGASVLPWLRTTPAWAQAAAGATAQAKIEVLLKEPIKTTAGAAATINPHLHGQFAEHIGGVIYDGIWVGPDSKIPNVNGIRKAIVDSMRKLALPNVRWPGGCFADRYHWRDGIGSRTARPRTFGRWNDTSESNAFGTHEFMDFCRQVQTEPYFCANVGTGTPEEFQQWVEYCNAPAGRLSTGDERVTNGASDPFRVQYWAVGNENWGCGGTFTPEDYCTEYRRFTTWLPGYGVPLTLVACGPSSNDLDWTRRFFKKWVDGPRAPLTAFAAHYYCGTSGTATVFNTDQWYDLIDRAQQMEKLITDQWAVMGEFDPQHAVKLIVDEWGSWHPADERLRKDYAFCQLSTVRDALVAALTLDIFHRHADKLLMCNIAQLVNCLQSLYNTDGDKFVETVIHHVHDMYQIHKGATAVRMAVEAPNCKFSRENKPAEIFRVAGSASVHDKSVNLTLVHTHASEPVEVVLNLRDGKCGQVEAKILTHEKLNAFNHFDNPTDVLPKKLGIDASRQPLTLTLPPGCVASLRMQLV